MRYILFVISIFVCAAIADERDSVLNIISGKWLLTQKCGGISGGCFTALDSNIIIVAPDTQSADSVYYYNYINHELNCSLKVYLGLKGSSWAIFVPPGLGGILVGATDTTIVLSDGAYADGFYYYFKKIF